MMKRFLGCVLSCAILLSMVTLAVAQSPPTPVTRLGDWVEVGNEVYINFIASTRIHYQWTDNYDFESDIQDRVPSRSNTSTVPHDGDGDLSFQETRVGLDLRYQDNLRARILLENQMTWDGNRIDNGFDLDGDSPATQRFRDGNNLSCQSASAAEGSPQPVSSSCLQRNTVNLERAWIEYTFPGTPITFDVGARIRSYDPGRMLGDDDPGIRVVTRFGPNKELRLSAAAIIQTESLRIGLQNDNDDVYYVFEGSYNRKPYQVGMSVAYFRFRFRGATGQSLAGQKVDSVMLTPYVTGTIGPFRGLIQPMFVFGSADGSDATGNIDYDIASFGVVAAVHVNLGAFRPYAGIIFGTGDDDVTDNDLGGFNPFPDQSITLIGGSPFFSPLTDSIFVGDRDVVTPARAGGFGGSQFLSTIFSPWHDRVGNTLHTGINTAYSNPGTLLIPVGVQITPLKGHNVNLYYVYRAVVESGVLEASSGIDSISKSLMHELGLQYVWRLNAHFNFKLLGNLIIPDAGAKDIAESVFACGDSGTEQCEGEDIALRLGLRFQATF